MPLLLSSHHSCFVVAFAYYSNKTSPMLLLLLAIRLALTGIGFFLLTLLPCFLLNLHESTKRFLTDPPSTFLASDPKRFWSCSCYGDLKGSNFLSLSPCLLLFLLKLTRIFLTDPFDSSCIERQRASPCWYCSCYEYHNGIV